MNMFEIHADTDHPDARALVEDHARRLAEELNDAAFEVTAFDADGDAVAQWSSVEGRRKPDTAADEPRRTTCGCGYDLVWSPDDEEWQHDAAPFLWGDDHEPDPQGEIDPASLPVNCDGCGERRASAKLALCDDCKAGA